MYCHQICLSGEHNGFLLGDSGYPTRRSLLTPYIQPRNNPQERYNRSLCRTRVLIEQTFGVLKKRFRCLHTELITVPHQAVTYITACAVLHNIGIFRGDVIPFDLDFIQEGDQPVIQINDVNDGAGIREHIVQTFFSQ